MAIGRVCIWIGLSLISLPCAAQDTETVTTEVQPITEAEIAATFIDTCVASYPSVERLRSSLQFSRFEYEEAAPTNGGAKLNWDASFGWVGLTGQLSGLAEDFTPQCEFNAFTEAELDVETLTLVLDRELRAHLGPDNVRNVESSWLVVLASGESAAIQRVPRGGPNQAILIVSPATALGIDE